MLIESEFQKIKKKLKKSTTAIWGGRFPGRAGFFKVEKALRVIHRDCSRGSWATDPAATSFILPVVSGVTSEAWGHWD